jgi:hypothetical protein
MDQKTFTAIASAIFAAVALVQVLRIYFGWPVVIGTWSVPMWISWIAVVVDGGMSYFGMSLARRG